MKFRSPWRLGLSLTIREPVPFFDRTKRSTTQRQKILDLKRDFLTSLASVARAVKAHGPTLVLGEGQGALIALGLTCPLVLEATLALRNVDIKEALGIARMWGRVKGVIVRNPQVFKTQLSLNDLRAAMPEMFDSDHPWQHLKCFGIKDSTSPTVLEIVQL